MKFTFCNFENMQIETHYIPLSELIALHNEMRQLNKYHNMNIKQYYDEFKVAVELSIMMMK